MTSLFLPDNLFEPFNNLFVGASVPQPRPEVMFRHTEQAGSYLAIGRQADAIAVAAEWLADGSDNADFATAIGEHPAFRCGRRILDRGGPQIKPRLQTAKDLTPGNDHFFEPRSGGIQWHKLDKSKTQVVGVGELRQGFK